ncbi:MAG: L,D-transpeptidase family protein [Hyphomicrobiales bacterium]
MRSVSLNGYLTGTAVALVLALVSSSHVLAQSPANAAKAEAAVPAPESANAPPPAASDASPKADAPAAVATPAAMSASDSAIADKLREMSSGKFDRTLASKKERTSVEAFYNTRNFAPLWISNGAVNERGKTAIAYLAGVDAEGLDPSEYPRPDFKAATDAAALADAEMNLTASLLSFARHAQTGRIHYSRVAGDILYTLVASEPADVLGKLAAGNNAATALDGFNPQQPGYKALKAELAKTRKQGADAGPVRIESGPTLKTGKVLVTDARVPELRKRLGLPAGNDITYDKELEDAVTKFQKGRGLPANGTLNTATLDAINGPRRDRDEDIIIANMERWRWVPRDLGNPYVMVNIPDYTLRIVKDGATYWKTKIVVGKPNLATPLTSAEMKFITVNPTWNVPPSIIQNEYLPALEADPTALERIGLKVEQSADGTVRIYQPPGERNALGRIRFNFPNKFLVYQHDTPDKNLFAHDKRAYSHGCMRVQDPLMYGEKILSLALPKEGYTAERLQKMFGGSEVNINFPTFIPVHLTYQTAFVEDGKLQIRDDVYGRDARMLAILKGSERKVADIAIERSGGSSSKPVRLAPGTFGGSRYGGGNFFEMLFGGPSRPSVPVRNNGRVSSR